MTPRRQVGEEINNFGLKKEDGIDREKWRNTVSEIAANISRLF